jgi:serine/threonine-protein kinase
MTHRPAASFSPERWREVFAAVDRALELAPAERESFVEQFSTADPALGAELRALLSSAEDTSALDRSAAAFAGPLLAQFPPQSGSGPSESRVGPYRLVGVIGHGGMGAVYLAERADDQYRKRVALKLLPGWGARDEHRVRRFLEERQILAGLEHPDIARLLDGGVTTDGLPWFAMEYIEGEPIDRYCDARSLSIEPRLDLFCRVCTAVQYAHRNLIVHRDLKPANILVSGDGAVKLLDFGIAKLLGGDGASASDALTQTGERVMTPLYASPEQVRGDPVSTASDVYALGVLLYELLAGRHPYRLSTRRPHDVARAVLEQEPERPSATVLHAGAATDGEGTGTTLEQAAKARQNTQSKLCRRLRGDLDAICLKAMEKDPRHRYGSVEQLEADVRRHLAGLPITARPANRLYRARKFLRRHRVGAVVTGGVTLLVLGFTVITMVQSLRIRAQAERIAAEQSKAATVENHLANVFRTSIPSPAEGRGVTAREVLDSSAARAERDLSGQPGMLARVLTELGRVYRELGFSDRARDLLEASVALQRRSPDEPLALASTLLALGEVLLEQRELQRAEGAYQEALELRRKALDSSHGQVARTLNGLSALRLAQGRFGEAETLSRRALEIDREQTGDNRLDVAQSLRAVGRALMAGGRYAEAAEHCNAALSLLRERLPEEHLEVAGTILDLAQARRGNGGNTAADSLLRYGLALQRRAAAAATLALSWDSAPLSRLAAPASSPQPGRTFTSKIVFESDRDRPDAVGALGHHEIYIMNPDGSDQRRLTHSNGRVSAPALSPDGRRIAFSGQWGGIHEIFVVSASGGEPVRVTNMSALGLGAGWPTWAPDGERLAFSSLGQGGDVYVINADGTGLRNLTRHPAPDSRPEWSPSGGRIAFLSRRDQTREIYVMNEDGTEPVRLTFNADSKSSRAWAPSPAWSPDGRKIAFTSDRDGNREIYVMNADGTGLTRLTNDDVDDENPSWSPHGNQVAFNRRVLGHHQIFVMNADGSAPTRLTELSPAVANIFPSWGRNAASSPARRQSEH